MNEMQWEKQVFTWKFGLEYICVSVLVLAILVCHC